MCHQVGFGRINKEPGPASELAAAPSMMTGAQERTTMFPASISSMKYIYIIYPYALTRTRRLDQEPRAGFR